MFRRRFLQLVTMASVGGLAPLEAVSAAATRTVTYHVKGFTCITCATGLDTLLSQQKGIALQQINLSRGQGDRRIRSQPDNRASHRRLHHRSGLYRATRPQKLRRGPNMYSQS